MQQNRVVEVVNHELNPRSHLIFGPNGTSCSDSFVARDYLDYLNGAEVDLPELSAVETETPGDWVSEEDADMVNGEPDSHVRTGDLLEVAVLYDGRLDERKALREEYSGEDKFNELITHYDLIMRDKAFLKKNSLVLHDC